MEKKLAMQETLQLHEILTFKTLCVLKSKMIMPLVNDPQLKEILQQDLNVSTKHVEEIETMLRNNQSMIA